MIVELNDFFANPKNAIKVIFTDENLNLLGIQEKDRQYFRASFLFMEHNVENEKEFYKFKRNVDPDQITLSGKKFDIHLYHKLFIETYHEWIRKYPSVPFPDINIYSGKRDSNYESASILIDRVNWVSHQMWLPIFEFENLDHLKYCVGHELGHLIYEYNYKNQHLENLKDKSSKENSIIKKLFPYELFFIAISVSLLEVFFLYNIDKLQENLSLGLSAFLILNLTMFFIVALIAYSLARRESRFINYTTEYFCDYFAFHFYNSFNKIDIKNLHFWGSINSFSHPAGALRSVALQKFKEVKDLDQWTNPLDEYAFFHRNCSWIEIKFEYDHFKRIKNNKNQSPKS